MAPEQKTVPAWQSHIGHASTAWVQLAVPGNRAQAVGTGMRPEGPHTHSVVETMERTRRPPTPRGSVLRAPSELSHNTARVTHKMGHKTEIKVKNCRKIRFHICYLSVGGLRFTCTITEADRRAETLARVQEMDGQDLVIWEGRVRTVRVLAWWMTVFWPPEKGQYFGPGIIHKTFPWPEEIL